MKKAKCFKTTVLGVGPYCVEFPDGEIITTRSEERQKAIANFAALTWTPTPPTVPGWYWWRHLPTWKSEVVQVHMFKNTGWWCSNSVALKGKGEWAGPLAEPQGQEGG
jgi:hypothetical protein